MSKKIEFIKYVENLMNEHPVEMNDEARLYWEAFRTVDETEKPLFTDNGKLILKFLQENSDSPVWKARDIADNMVISSRSVSGAMRKLVMDGYVEKLGQDPAVYSLTEKGKNIEII